MTTREDELVERLRDESTALQRASWSRPDGGQDGCIAASLADEAASMIEALSSERDLLRLLVEESLFHLRLDDRAKDYHNRATAALTGVTGG